MSYDTDFSFDASPLVISRTDGDRGWSVSVIGPGDMENDQSLALGILHLMLTGDEIHILARSNHRWVYGLVEDSTFTALIFPEFHEPIQVDDDRLRDVRDITVSSGRSTQYEFTVSDYRETPWFRDSYGYMLMYDHLGRYIMIDRDPKTIDSTQKVISGPTELLKTSDSSEIDRS